MSEYDRSPMEDTEIARLKGLKGKVLAALTKSPQTNKELSKIALDYRRRVQEIRRAGYTIVCDKINRGLTMYSLQMEKEPQWDVDVLIRGYDGRGFMQTVTVRAGSEAVARNRAAYVAAKHKVIVAEQRDPPF